VKFFFVVLHHLGEVLTTVNNTQNELLFVAATIKKTFHTHRLWRKHHHNIMIVRYLPRETIEGVSIDFSMKEIQKICDGLGVDVDMLMNWDQKQVNRLNAQAELLASLSEKEIRVDLAYREHTELQAAIDKLLEIKE